jgi:hypothetical protein
MKPGIPDCLSQSAVNIDIKILLKTFLESVIKTDRLTSPPLPHKQLEQFQTDFL